MLVRLSRFSNVHVDRPLSRGCLLQREHWFEGLGVLREDLVESLVLVVLWEGTLYDALMNDRPFVGEDLEA